MHSASNRPDTAAFAPVARLARQLLDVPITFVTVIGAAGELATHLLNVDDELDNDWTALSAAFAQLSVAADGVLAIHDGRRDARLAELIHASPTCSCLAERLVDVGGVVRGVFGVIDRRERTWTDRDRSTLSDLSGFAIAEIERRDAVGLKVAHDHSTKQLFQLAKALAAAAGIDEIMQRTSRIAGDLVGASLAQAAIVDPETGDLKLHYGKSIGAGDRDRSVELRLSDETPLGRAVLTGAPVHMNSPAELLRNFPLEVQPSAASGVHALAVYPTRRGHAAIGFAWTHPVAFNDPLKRTLATVAELFGLGLERASASDRDRAVADRLQRSLLPGLLPFVPGAHTAAMYEAGAANLEVGGDWYDVVAAGPDRYVLGIGDVVGRGLHAAVTMGELRHAFAALVSRTDSLSAIVENLDHSAQNVEGARLSTMVAASYQPSTGDLELISAGHMPPMVLRASGEVIQLPNGGPPLGLGDDIARSTMNTTLAAGDSLWLYTDGLVERRGESVDVGLARLQRAIAHSRDSDTATALREVYEELDMPVSDDVAVVVLSKTSSVTP